MLKRKSVLAVVADSKQNAMEFQKAIVMGFYTHCFGIRIMLGNLFPKFPFYVIFSMQITSRKITGKNRKAIWFEKVKDFVQEITKISMFKIMHFFVQSLNVAFINRLLAFHCKNKNILAKVQVVSHIYHKLSHWCLRRV